MLLYIGIICLHHFSVGEDRSDYYTLQDCMQLQRGQKCNPTKKPHMKTHSRVDSIVRKVPCLGVLQNNVLKPAIIVLQQNKYIKASNPIRYSFVSTLSKTRTWTDNIFATFENMKSNVDYEGIWTRNAELKIIVKHSARRSNNSTKYKPWYYCVCRYISLKECISILQHLYKPRLSSFVLSWLFLDGGRQRRKETEGWESTNIK